MSNYIKNIKHLIDQELSPSKIRARDKIVAICSECESRIITLARVVKEVSKRHNGKYFCMSCSIKQSFKKGRIRRTKKEIEESKK